jgi:hypothetical protein
MLFQKLELPAHTHRYAVGLHDCPAAKRVWDRLQTTRAVKGHEFGLKLPDQDKTALIAFLNTL